MKARGVVILTNLAISAFGAAVWALYAKKASDILTEQIFGTTVEQFEQQMDKPMVEQFVEPTVTSNEVIINVSGNEVF